MLQRGLNYLTDAMVGLVIIVALEALLDYLSGFSLFRMGRSVLKMGGLFETRSELGFYLGAFSALVLSLGYRYFLRQGNLS